MLAAKKDYVPNYHRYSIVSRWTQFEGSIVLQYGLEQITLDGYGNAVKTAVLNVTDSKETIKELLSLVEHQDIPPDNLEEIVEDFIAEKASVI